MRGGKARGRLDTETVPEIPKELPEEKPNGKDGEHVDWRTLFDTRKVADLAGKPLPPRIFAVSAWLPLAEPAVLSGPGGVGKSLLAMQLMAAASRGAPFLGLETIALRSHGWFTEDSWDELHRRFHDIAAMANVDLADIPATYESRRDADDNVLVVEARNGNLERTPIMAALAQQVADENIRLLVLDHARQIAAVREFDGSVVTRTVRMLGAMMAPTGGNLLLLAHPNKALTSEVAGSAAWGNSVRTQLYLGPAKADADDDAEVDVNDPRRVLRKSKANYAAKDEMTLEWSHGAFRCVDPRHATFADKLDAGEREGRARTAFIAGLANLTTANRNASDSPQAGNFAPRMIFKGGLGDGFTVKELTAAMESLFREGRLDADADKGRRKGRHRKSGLAMRGPLL